jgi:N4-gp56 family major capsid protein
MIHNIPAMLKRMPREGGSTFRMRRYNPLETATVPLGNTGVTPPPQTLTAVDIDATPDFYGTYISLNEQVTLQSQDPVLNEAAQRLGVSLNTLGDNKSFIIDLEFLTDNAEDDRGQAEVEILCAA